MFPKGQEGCYLALERVGNTRVEMYTWMINSQITSPPVGYVGFVTLRYDVEIKWYLRTFPMDARPTHAPTGDTEARPGRV